MTPDEARFSKRDNILGPKVPNAALMAEQGLSGSISKSDVSSFESGNPGASGIATGAQKNAAPRRDDITSDLSHLASVEPLHLLVARMEREAATQDGHPDDEWLAALQSREGES